MPTDMKLIQQIAHILGYEKPTELQRRAFDSKATRKGKDLFVIGETSTGKTLIPMLLYYEEWVKAAREGRMAPKMLFVVPYRALAAQKHREIEEELRVISEHYDIPQPIVVESTGEFRQNDREIEAAEIDIAVIIAEKVYRYESRQAGFLAQYDYLVLDEVGLVNDPERGIRMDFVIAWAQEERRAKGKPRTIALGTPSFDWTAYIESYGFKKIAGESRPIILREYPVIYSKNGGIESIPEDSPILKRTRLYQRRFYEKRMAEAAGQLTTPCDCADGGWCALDTKCRQEESGYCKNLGAPCKDPVVVMPYDMTSYQYILTKICEYHLKQGHQILIFKNNREEVRGLCRMLWDRLKHLLPEPPAAEECKRQILDECDLSEEDVYGILEDATDYQYYEAFMAGIAFHSAAMPNELRTLVENWLLDERRMRIVCCTETLAYGVNSSVEVVVVADLSKQVSGRTSLLTLNEYRNYLGRAGRLNRGKSEIEGYVYTLAKKNGKSNMQVAHLETLRSEASSPSRLYSHLYDSDNDKLPFFLLNLMSLEGNTALGEVFDDVDRLPKPLRDYSGQDDFLSRVTAALDYLVNEDLAVCNSTQYGLTFSGERLRGYIIGSNDYDLLKSVLLDAHGGLEGRFEKEFFLFKLLTSRHVETSLNSAFANSSTKLDARELIKFFDTRGGEFNAKSAEWLLPLRYGTADSRDEKILYALAALLSWMDGWSAKQLQVTFGVHYPLLQGLAEQVGYMVEVARAIVPALVEDAYRTRLAPIYEKLGMSVDIYDILDQRDQEMKDLFLSIYYGINLDVYRDLIGYLSTHEGASAELMLYELRDSINPDTARMIRRIVVRYRFFDDDMDMRTDSVEDSNNRANQRWQYRHDVNAMEPCIREFFKERFPDAGL